MLKTSFFALQIKGYNNFFKEDDPLAATVLLVSVTSIVVILLVVNLARHGIGPSGLGGNKSAVSPRRFNGSAMRRIARDYSLNHEQSKLLEFVFRNDSVADPERIMQDSAALDRHFKRAYKSIERNAKSEEEIQQRTSRLFSLRNAIEAAPGPESTAASKKVPANTPAVLSTGKDNYPVRVVLADRENVTVENPRTALGSMVHIPSGARITLSFFTKSSKGFSYAGKVIGSAPIPRGEGLLINFTGRPKLLAKRRYRRAQFNGKCAFNMVLLEETGKGRKKTQKLVVDKRAFKGTLQDISIGGCSMKTTAMIQVGMRLKMIIDSDEGAISVLGQVIRTNRSGSAGTVLHIKFLKVPRGAFNAISAAVFGFNKD
jgi:hypothetical protein